jgi:hypothetical protein
MMTVPRNSRYPPLGGILFGSTSSRRLDNRAQLPELCGIFLLLSMACRHSNVSFRCTFDPQSQNEQATAPIGHLQGIAPHLFVILTGEDDDRRHRRHLRFQYTSKAQLDLGIQLRSLFLSTGPLFDRPT